jgi:gluconokinase
MGEFIPALVVMGVCGCGKSSVGAAISTICDGYLIEGDAFHPASNVEKMRAGIPLTDEDRLGWLKRLGEEMASAIAAGERPVLACSALKRSYRDILRSAVPGLGFIFLEMTPELSRQRVAQRKDHYMPASLVESQFAAIEPPYDEAATFAVDAALPIDEIAERSCNWWNGAGDQQPRLSAKVV